MGAGCSSVAPVPRDTMAPVRRRASVSERDSHNAGKKSGAIAVKVTPRNHQHHVEVTEKHNEQHDHSDCPPASSPLSDSSLALSTADQPPPHPFLPITSYADLHDLFLASLPSSLSRSRNRPVSASRTRLLNRILTQMNDNVIADTAASPTHESPSPPTPCDACQNEQKKEEENEHEQSSQFQPQPQPSSHSHPLSSLDRKDRDGLYKLLVTSSTPQQHRLNLWIAALRMKEMDMGEEKEKEQYLVYISQPSPADGQISRDIHRTFPQHSFFQHMTVQQCIGRLLHAWSLYCPSISYVQGHNYIAAMLLWVCEGDELLAWRLFRTLLNHPTLGIGSMYAHQLTQLMAHCTQLGEMLPVLLPQLSSHLTSLGLDTLMYGTPFYLTLFTHHLEIEHCVHLWDIILLTHTTAKLQPQVVMMEKSKRNKTTRTAAVAPEPIPADSSQPHNHTAASLADSSTSSPSPVPRLSSSPIVFAITALCICLLSVSSSSLLRHHTMDVTFRAIQGLNVMREKKSRKKVFELFIQAYAVK